MRILRSFLAASLLCAPLAACGDDGGEVPAPDGQVPDTNPPPPETMSVTIHARGAKLVAIREGADGAWRALTPAANGDVTAEIVKGPYAISAVCDDPDFFDDYLILAGPTDTTDHIAYCSETHEAVPVSITSDVDVDVKVGFHHAVDGTIYVVPGTYDVVAIEKNAETPRFVIRRGVELAEGSMLTFDLATEGTAMRAVGVTAATDDAEVANRYAGLVTAAGTRVSSPDHADEDKVWAFPAAALAAGDRQHVTVTAEPAEASPASRTVSQVVTTDVDSVALTLPPPITAAHATWNGALGVGWTATGTWENRYAYAMNEDYSRLWDIQAYAGWFAAGGDADSMAMPDPTTLPGWKPEWNRASAAGFEWDLWLDHSPSEGVYQHSEWLDSFAATKTAAAKSPARELPAIVQQRLAR